MTHPKLGPNQHLHQNTINDHCARACRLLRCAAQRYVAHLRNEVVRVERARCRALTSQQQTRYVKETIDSFGLCWFGTLVPFMRSSSPRHLTTVFHFIYPPSCPIFLFRVGRASSVTHSFVRVLFPSLGFPALSLDACCGRRAVATLITLSDGCLRLIKCLDTSGRLSTNIYVSAFLLLCFSMCYPALVRALVERY